MLEVTSDQLKKALDDYLEETKRLKTVYEEKIKSILTDIDKKKMIEIRRQLGI